MPQGSVSEAAVAAASAGAVADAGKALPVVAAPNVELFAMWSAVGTILALAAFWRLVHHGFQLGLVSKMPKLGREKSSDGRSPRVLAGHCTSALNALICLAAWLPLAKQQLSAASWSPGALFPVWSKLLTISPPPLGASAFLICLSGYSLNALLLSIERLVAGSSAERAVCLQRGLVFVASGLVCCFAYVPEIALMLLLLEVPSPIVAAWHAIGDLRARVDPSLDVVGGVAVVAVLKVRILMFGLCMVFALTHHNWYRVLCHDTYRFLMTASCVALLVSYTVSFVRLAKDVRRSSQGSKGDPSKQRRASDLQV